MKPSMSPGHCIRASCSPCGTFPSSQAPAAHRQWAPGLTILGQSGCFNEALAPSKRNPAVQSTCIPPAPPPRPLPAHHPRTLPAALGSSSQSSTEAEPDGAASSPVRDGTGFSRRLFLGCLLPRGRCKQGTCCFPRRAVLRRVPVPPAPALKPVLSGPAKIPSIKASSAKHRVTSSKCPLGEEQFQAEHHGCPPRSTAVGVLWPRCCVKTPVGTEALAKDPDLAHRHAEAVSAAVFPAWDAECLGRPFPLHTPLTPLEGPREKASPPVP